MTVTSGIASLSLILLIIFFAIALVAGIVFLIVSLCISASRKNNISEAIKKEKAEKAKSLGEVLTQHRTQCKMTQEFVAETLGVSRQAVSKWERGISDPSTTNLMALAKLYDVTAEELLKEVQ